uniref:Uncharacterized protein n=1 Tax=Arundo donax TaxID=35708 RepID=A0A0A9BAA8_ARUDO
MDNKLYLLSYKVEGVNQIAKSDVGDYHDDDEDDTLDDAENAEDEGGEDKSKMEDTDRAQTPQADRHRCSSKGSKPMGAKTVPGSQDDENEEVFKMMFGGESTRDCTDLLRDMELLESDNEKEPDDVADGRMRIRR